MGIIEFRIETEDDYILSNIFLIYPCLQENYIPEQLVWKLYVIFKWVYPIYQIFLSHRFYQLIFSIINIQVSSILLCPFHRWEWGDWKGSNYLSQVSRQRWVSNEDLQIIKNKNKKTQQTCFPLFIMSFIVLILELSKHRKISLLLGKLCIK